jgi:hypothetical protein
MNQTLFRLMGASGRTAFHHQRETDLLHGFFQMLPVIDHNFSGHRQAIGRKDLLGLIFRERLASPPQSPIDQPNRFIRYHVFSRHHRR